MDAGVAPAGESGFMSGMSLNEIVVVDPELMNGTPCFAGTRVPVRNLLDYLEAGDTLDEFLDQFPGVSREKAVAFMEQSSRLLIESVTA